MTHTSAGLSGSASAVWISWKHLSIVKVSLWFIQLIHKCPAWWIFWCEDWMKLPASLQPLLTFSVLCAALEGVFYWPLQFLETSNQSFHTDCCYKKPKTTSSSVSVNTHSHGDTHAVTGWQRTSHCEQSQQCGETEMPHTCHNPSPSQPHTCPFRFMSAGTEQSSLTATTKQ